MRHGRSAALAICTVALLGCGQSDPRVEQAADVAERSPDAVISTPPSSRDVSASVEVRIPPAPDPVGPVEEVIGDEVYLLPYHCESDQDCESVCADSATCEANVCRHVGSAKCIIVDDTAEQVICAHDGSPNPDNSCLGCVPQLDHERFTGIFVMGDFQGELTPFEKLPQATDASVRWHMTYERSVLGDQSLRFGRPDEASYEGEGRVFGRATTSLAPLPTVTHSTLWFWLWLETEETAGYDILSVYLRVNGVESLIWDSDSIAGTTHGNWELIEVPVVLEEAVVDGQLIFEFDSVDGIIDFFEGVYIDHLTLSTGCCVNAEDCRDSDPCTADICGPDGQCVHTVIEDCCHNDDDCTEGTSCEVSDCARPGESCTYTPIKGCCAADQDCDDGVACTEDICLVDQQACIYAELCCNFDGDCRHDEACFVGTCVGGECAYDDRCCASDAVCQDDDPCTDDVCNQGVCQHLVSVEGDCCQSTLYHEAFSQGVPANWSMTQPLGGVGWWVTHVFEGVPTPPGVLYYGNPVAKNFDSGGLNMGTMTSSLIVLPAGVQLSLSISALLDVEPFSGVDAFRVTILGPGGENTIFDKSDFELGAWTTNQADISAYGGQEVNIIFRFNSVGPENNQGLGVLLDDLIISTSCEAATCDVDVDCAGQDDCIQGTCVAGVCAYNEVCCMSDLDCQGDDPCTVGVCESGVCFSMETPGCCTTTSDCQVDDVCTFGLCHVATQSCVFQPITGCCIAATSCDDGDPCTLDQCLDNICTHQPQCCVVDSDCDDDEPICTVDTCVEGMCQHAFSGLEGCCISTPLDWTFDDAVTFEMTATTPPCQWQITEAPQSFSGAQVLYYGNTTEWNYDCGHNTGEALSLPITLAPSFEYTLSFALYLGVEDNAVFDLLTLSALVDGESVLLWDKTSVAAVSNWHVYSVDVSALAGRTFELLFAFDSVDEVANGTPGIYIDDVMIASSCMPVACLDDAGCDDQLSDTSESCAFDGCRYTIP